MVRSILARFQRPRLLGVLALSVIGGGAIFALSGPREPRYAGRALSAWLAELDSDNGRAQAKAAQAVQGIGTNALPWLARMLCFRDPAWRRAGIWLNSRQSLVRLPVAPAGLVAHRALRAYLELGKAAAAGVPELIRILNEEPSPQARVYAATALGGIGSGAKIAIPALRRATQDPANEVRESALLALANIEGKLDSPALRER